MTDGKQRMAIRIGRPSNSFSSRDGPRTGLVEHSARPHAIADAELTGLACRLRAQPACVHGHERSAASSGANGADSLGRITTHVLDLVSGRPASGVPVELWALNDPSTLLARAITNADGRLDQPLIDVPALPVGTYELRFHVGAYLASEGLNKAEPPFLDVVPVRFGVSDPDRHQHVPLLLSSYGYSTYRGS